jgi:hypothetical protein
MTRSGVGCIKPLSIGVSSRIFSLMVRHGKQSVKRWLHGSLRLPLGLSRPT